MDFKQRDIFNTRVDVLLQQLGEDFVRSGGKAWGSWVFQPPGSRHQYVQRARQPNTCIFMLPKLVADMSDCTTFHVCHLR